MEKKVIVKVLMKIVLKIREIASIYVLHITDILFLGGKVNFLFRISWFYFLLRLGNVGETLHNNYVTNFGKIKIYS